jgi:drug/metabolite transporter (DMT)-like permease
MAIAVIALAPLYLLHRRGKDPLSSREIRLALLGGLFFACDLGFWATGVMLSGATIPTLLANSAPLWVGIGAFLIFREKLRRTFWIGLALAIAGALFVLGVDTLRAATLGLGSAFGLLAGFFFGAYYLVTQRARMSLNSLTYFWLSSLSSTLVLLLANLALKQPLHGYSPRTYLNFLAMGLITQVAGYLAINYALGRLPATLVSTALLGQPVVTALLAGAFLGEVLGMWQILGAAVVLTGVILVHRSRLPQQADGAGP